MPKWICPIAASLIMMLSACGGVDKGADVAPLSPPSTVTATVTLAPPTETSLPTSAPTEIVTGEVVDTVTMEPTLTPTDTPTPEPTATPTPEPDWLAWVGRTEAGLMFLGNPDAPVTIIDYSDFM